MVGFRRGDVGAILRWNWVPVWKHITSNQELSQLQSAPGRKFGRRKGSWGQYRVPCGYSLRGAAHMGSSAHWRLAEFHWVRLGLADCNGQSSGLAFVGGESTLIFL